MALDPKLLEILACPEDKGPLLYFVDEDVALQPAPEAAVRGARRHPDHADRRGRDGRRRRARAPARRRPRPTASQPTFDGLSRARVTDRLAGLPRRGRRAARAARGRARGRGRRSHARRASRRPTTIRNIVVLGMGGSGIAGDVLAAVANDELPVPVTVLKQYRTPGVRRAAARSRSRCRTRATPRRRCRWRTARVDAGAPARRGVARRRARRARAARGGAARAVPDGLSAARRARRAGRAAVRHAVPHRARCPSAHALLVRGAGAARAPARPRAGPRSRARPTRRASSPARSAARSRSSTAAARSARSRRMRWKCDVNENAKAPAFWNAYPELDHNEICGWGQHGDVTRQLFTLVELRHGFEHARLAPALRRHARAHRGVRAPGARGARPRARAGSRSCSTSCTSATGRAATSRSTNDVDPGPIDAITAAEGRRSRDRTAAGRGFSTDGVATPGREAVGLRDPLDPAGPSVRRQGAPHRRGEAAVAPGARRQDGVVVPDERPGQGGLGRRERRARRDRARSPGSATRAQIGQRHRLVGITDCDILEVSTPEIGTTHRLEDDYARPDETEAVRSSPAAAGPPAEPAGTDRTAR